METVDIEKASTDLAADLGVGFEAPAGDLDSAIDTAAQPGTDDVELTAGRDADGKFKAKGADTDPAADPAADPASEDYTPPQSWKKEMHGIWDKLARGVPLNAEESKQATKYYREREKQMLDGVGMYKSDAEYARSLRPAFAKHEDLLQASGISPADAVDRLMNGHRRLSSGTPDQRKAALMDMAKYYGIQLAPADPNAEPVVVDPNVKALQERVELLSNDQQQRQQREYQEIRARNAEEVNAFAADTVKNPYFEECADHICMLLKADPKMSLADAYKTAVYANPVTHQKELARLQKEWESERQKKMDAAAKAAKKTTSTNVNGRDTTRTPTGQVATLDKLDEVLAENLAEIRSRTD